MNLLSWLDDKASSGGSRAPGSQAGRGVYLPDRMGRLDRGIWKKPETLPDPFGWLPGAERGVVSPGLDALLKDGITLSRPVGATGDNRPGDVAKVENLLGAAGHLDLDATDGPTGYFGGRVENAVKGFQKDAGLKVDGKLNPDGETIRELGKVNASPSTGGAPSKRLLPVTDEEAQKWRGTLPRPAITKPGYVWDKDHWRPATPEEEASAPRFTLLAAAADPVGEAASEVGRAGPAASFRPESPESSVRPAGNAVSNGTGGSGEVLNDPIAPSPGDRPDGDEDSESGFGGGFEADFSLGAQGEDGEGDSYFGKSMIELYEDEWLAARQGTSPIVQSHDGTFNYERAPSDEQSFFAEAERVTDPDKYVVLRDPETGKLVVWNRNLEMDESGLIRAGRMLGAGLLADPVRISKASRAVSRAPQGLSGLAGAAARANEKFGQWVGDIRAASQARAAGKPFDKAVPRMVRVGEMDEDVQRFIRSRGIVPATADITATDNGIFHMTRQAKAQAGKALPMEAVERMPEILGNPSAVLWDKNKKNLSYVFDVPGDPNKGKFVVDVNFKFRRRQVAGGKPEAEVINVVKSGGVVPTRALSDTNIYDVIKGKL